MPTTNKRTLNTMRAGEAVAIDTIHKIAMTIFVLRGVNLVRKAKG